MQNPTNKEDFLKIRIQSGKLWMRAELAEMFNTIAKAEMFSGCLVKGNSTSCFRCPPEPIIVQDVLKRA